MSPGRHEQAVPPGQHYTNIKNKSHYHYDTLDSDDAVNSPPPLTTNDPSPATTPVFSLLAVQAAFGTPANSENAVEKAPNKVVPSNLSSLTPRPIVHSSSWGLPRNKQLVISQPMVPPPFLVVKSAKNGPPVCSSNSTSDSHGIPIGHTSGLVFVSQPVCAVHINGVLPVKALTVPPVAFNTSEV